MTEISTYCSCNLSRYDGAYAVNHLNNCKYAKSRFRKIDDWEYYSEPIQISYKEGEHMEMNGANFQPLYDKVLIKKTASDEKTSAGIYLPEESREKTYMGEVVAVGKGKIMADGFQCRPTVTVGDIVYLPKYSGTEIGTDYIIYREDEILGIAKKAK